MRALNWNWPSAETSSGSLLSRLRETLRALVRRPAPPICPPDPIEQLEARLLKQPQLEFPLKHRFAPGVYVREIFMPAGAFVIGQRHITEHFNIVLAGQALVMMDGKTERICGPCVFPSGVGVRKVLLIEEDMTWITVHPTRETDLAKLEKELIMKSPSYVKHYEELASLQAMQKALGGAS